MKLLYFIPLLSTIGGQERTLIDKAHYLINRGHEVLFVTYEHEGPIAYELDPQIGHLDLGCHFFNLYKYPIRNRIWKAIELKRTFRRRMSRVISDFCPNVIVIAIPNTENFICDVVSIASNIPIIIESHLAQGYEVVHRGVSEKWLYYIYNPLNAIRKADLMIALTKGDADRWKKKGVHNICVIPDPVTHYESDLISGIKEEGRIICVGRLTCQKRFDRVIEAFSLLALNYPQWHIDIYGTGEDEEILKSLIRKMNLQERVSINAPVSDIYTEYKKSQFLVMSSDFEGFGMVIVEAMACSIPVVATDCPFGPSEIIEDGKTGLLAKMEVRDLAEKMEWMIVHESERQTMGMMAHRAAARYKKDVVIEEWERAYLSVIK